MDVLQIWAIPAISLFHLTTNSCQTMLRVRVEHLLGSIQSIIMMAPQYSLITLLPMVVTPHPMPKVFHLTLLLIMIGQHKHQDYYRK